MTIKKNDRPMRTARGERAERALARAVLELLDEGGFSNISVDRIASRAKVGKPTIYRRWSSKEELIAHVLGNVDPPEPIDPSDELVPGLVSILSNLERRLKDTRYGRIWQRLLGEADAYSGVIDLYEQQFILPRRRELAELLLHHIETGELRADLEINTAVKMLVASMLGSLLMPGQAYAALSSDQIVRLLIEGMRA